jgi:hypothetical protein
MNMSEVVHYKGTLRIIPELVGKNFSAAIAWLYDNGHEKDIIDCDFESEYLESDTIVIVNGEYYWLTRTNIDIDGDIFDAVKVPDGYDFEVKFYNGAVSFNDALDEAVFVVNGGDPR